jgi:hypothetical protein
VLAGRDPSVCMCGGSTLITCNTHAQGAMGSTCAESPLLPVSVKRSASLAKCSTPLTGDGSQVNGLRRLCCEGVMFFDWSLGCCSILLCYNYCVQSGMLHVECICEASLPWQCPCLRCAPAPCHPGSLLS